MVFAWRSGFVAKLYLKEHYSTKLLIPPAQFRTICIVHILCLTLTVFSTHCLRVQIKLNKLEALKWHHLFSDQMQETPENGKLKQAASDSLMDYALDDDDQVFYNCICV